MCLGRRDFLVSVGLGAVGLACTKPSSSTPAPSSKTTAALRVEVWHDTVCPWCRIGCHNLGTVLDGWSGPPVELVLHPFLLNPETPPEGHDLRAHLSEKYGIPAEQAFGRVTQAGARYGVTFNWDKVRIGPATAKSHALLASAPKEKQRPLLGAIHRAYFEEGQNLGDTAVLVAIGKSVGLNGVEAVVNDAARIAAIREQARSASMAGISGVPHFRFGVREVNGAVGPDALRQALEALAKG
jgi:predicted DsbA family dithiol-disulfide isomerase